MTIEKVAFEAIMSAVRGMYKRHQKGNLPGKSFGQQAGRMFRELAYLHDKTLITATAEKVIEELASYQKQFGLNPKLQWHIWPSRQGFTAYVTLSQQRVHWPEHHDAYLKLFIGPRDSWDKIAIHTNEEEKSWRPPSLYTKRMAKRWQAVENFDFPALLMRLREMVEEPYTPHKAEEEIPF